MPVPVDRSLLLPDTQYFPGSQHKSGIAMHHTVSGSARTSVRLWQRVKGDPAPDPRLWDALVSLASPRPTPVVSTTTTGTAGLTSRAIEDLFAENVTRINAMNTAAGSLVKALLMESVVQGDRHGTCTEAT